MPWVPGPRGGQRGARAGSKAQALTPRVTDRQDGQMDGPLPLWPKASSERVSGPEGLSPGCSSRSCPLATEGGREARFVTSRHTRNTEKVKRIPKKIF